MEDSQFLIFIRYNVFTMKIRSEIMLSEYFDHFLLIIFTNTNLERFHRQAENAFRISEMARIER